jgi:hypothetical protein
MVALSRRRSRRTYPQMTLNKMARSAKAAPWKTTAVRCPCPSRNASASTEAANGRSATSISSTVLMKSTTRSALRMWSNMM